MRNAWRITPGEQAGPFGEPSTEVWVRISRRIRAPIRQLAILKALTRSLAWSIPQTQRNGRRFTEKHQKASILLRPPNADHLMPAAPLRKLPNSYRPGTRRPWEFLTARLHPEFS